MRSKVHLVEIYRKLQNKTKQRVVNVKITWLIVITIFVIVINCHHQQEQQNIYVGIIMMNSTL